MSKLIIPFSFERQNKEPLEVDYKVKTLAELNDLEIKSTTYEGQQAYCVETSTLYIYNKDGKFEPLGKATFDFANESMFKGYDNKYNTIKTIGHRGIWGQRKKDYKGTTNIPQNSYESLRECYVCGTYGMEFDVQKASDGTFWVSHNNDLSSLTNNTGKISEMTENDLKKVILTDSLCGLPKLDEFLIACRRYNIIPFIELKETINVSNIESFINILYETGTNNNCFVMSYYPNLLKEVYRLNPKIKIQLISNTLSEEIVNNAFTNISNTVGFDVNYKSITKDLVKYIHKKGSYIIGWTVTNQNDFAEAFENGCDFIETESVINYADRNAKKVGIYEKYYPSFDYIDETEYTNLEDNIVIAHHTYKINSMPVIVRANFKTDGDTTRAIGRTLFNIRHASSITTNIDTTKYKWNMMCLTEQGYACDNYDWCTTKTQEFKNTVNEYKPAYGYLYFTKVDGTKITTGELQYLHTVTFKLNKNVADVAKTNITSNVLNATVNSGGSIYYSIKDGICYVRISGITVSADSNNQKILSKGSLPIPDAEITNGHYPIASTNSTNGLIVLTGEGGAIYYGSAMTIYTTISYPVKES